MNASNSSLDVEPPFELNTLDGRDLIEMESILGIVPHQVRGFISRMHQITPSFEAFPNCTACSFRVIDEYRKNGFKFLYSVFNDTSVLEQVADLQKYHTIDEDILSLGSDSNDEAEDQ